MKIQMVTTYLRRAYSSFAVHVFDVPPRLLVFLLFLLLLFLPITRVGDYTLGVLTTLNTFAIFAVSWDLLVGRSGQMSLGHALFFGVGAYSSALLYGFFPLWLRVPWLAIPLALPICFLAALVIGFPCLRVKGPYLALVTMAFPLILTSLIHYFGGITGGERGIRVPGFFPNLPINQQYLAEYYLTLLLLSASSIILYKVANSKTGIVFVSILDNELASKASGINVTKYKLLAFAISGSFAGLAGAIYAHLLLLRSAGPSETLGITVSFLPVIVTILGGIGTIYGPLIGAYIYFILDRYVLNILIYIPPELVQAKFFAFTLIVIILIIKWPRGIARFIVDKLQDLEETREIEERGKHIWKREKKKKK